MRDEVAAFLSAQGLGFTFEEGEPFEGAPVLRGSSADGYTYVPLVGRPESLNYIGLLIQWGREQDISDDEYRAFLRKQMECGIALLDRYATPEASEWFLQQVGAALDGGSIEATAEFGGRLVTVASPIPLDPPLDGVQILISFTE
jgi:hypothetical protein